ncbi:MAG: 2Fe-2S iron-sulfur cluster-binding protein [bacterium]|nr:2Fe-2S iron-sulfur cluster-binding protein [bacterium]MDE0288540.1 2Fe-2S iron-sulfur cluster-binding protein [bacterium]MDE0438801.1 2Fe-2S iron-sulfur cluster-binding protein [bacterium]
MKPVQVLVSRFDLAKGEHEARYEVAPGQQASILDLLRSIVEGNDPTLSFRSSCRVGMCGTCAVVVDGREALACQTAAPPPGHTVRVGPLRNLPVIKDLVVDPAPFFDRYIGVDPAGSGPASGQPAGPETTGDCITCGACLSACTMAAINKEYLGPAALFRGLRLVEEATGAEAETRLRELADGDGLYGCRGHLDCLSVCPKELALPQAISRLKRMAARRVWGLRAGS